MKFKKLSLLLLLLLLALLVTTACDKDDLPVIGKNGSASLSAPTGLSYNGEAISWNPVDGATKYGVTINGQVEFSAARPVWPYKANGADFAITVTAKNDNATSPATTVTFSALDQITDLAIDENGRVFWSPVSNASAYTVSVDGTETVCLDTFYEGFAEGRHVVKVRPETTVADASLIFYSQWSAEKHLTVLGKVKEDSIVFNNETNRISWDGVAGATGYEVSLQTDLGIENETVNRTSFECDPQLSSFTLSLRAIGDHVNSFDCKEAVDKTFVYLGTVQNVHVADGILYWDAIERASGYKVRLNNSRILTVKDASYTDLPTNQSIDVEILPTCDETLYFASWSVKASVRILPSPTLIWNGNHDAFDGSDVNAISWQPIDASYGYTVRVTYTDKDGTVYPSEEYTKGKIDVGFSYAFPDAGTYTVEVKCNSDDNDPNVSDSKYCPPIRVLRLPAPTLVKNGISSNDTDLQSGFTATFNPVSFASGYRVWKDQTLYQSVNTYQFHDGAVIAEDVLTEQSIVYKVDAVGKNIAVSDKGEQTVVLDSLTSAAMTFEIKVLAVPEVNDMSGYIYSYGTVNGATGYCVNVSGTNKISGNQTCDLSDLTPGTYSVKVSARGNGTNVLASNYSAPLSIYRLTAPYDIKVLVEGASEGVLSFSTDANGAATGYTVYIDGSETAIPVNEYTNMKQYITTKGTDIFLRAEANTYNALRTQYIMTSPASQTLHITKLSPPTFGNSAFTNTQMVWNPSSGAIRYEVYNAQELLATSPDGTTMPLDLLEGGRDYTFTVRAIGDGVNYFNSDNSEARSVYKLKSPTVTRGRTDYKWNAVTDAVSYAVYVDGVLSQAEIHVSGSEYSFTPAFKELDTYTVEVKAIGDGGVHSIDSAPTVIQQTTRQLTTPDFKFSYSKDRYAPDGEIILEITLESPDALGYSYSVGGVEANSTEKIYRYNPNGAGSYILRVYALGGGFDSDGVYLINSQNCGGSDSYTITLLTAVNQSGINLSMDGRLSWTSVPLATGYMVTLTINGEAQDTFRVDNPAYDLNESVTFSQVDSLTVTIQAVGNTRSVPSALTERTWAPVTH